MTIKFHRNDNILYYNVQDVIKGIDLENQGEKVFIFDSNFSQMHFFNYFAEMLKEEESYGQLKIIEEKISKILQSIPVTFEDSVAHCFSLVEYTDDVKKIFSITTPQVICAFLYPNFFNLIYDEFYFFYFKSELLQNLFKKFNTQNIQQIIYEIVLGVSYKLKDKVGTINFVPETFELNESDLHNFNIIPKDVNTAIDWLVQAIQNNGKSFSDLKFDGSESIDVLTCLLYGRVSHMLLYTWYLQHEKSPLRLWFFNNRKINDPFYCVYYVIRNFVNFITLKYSVEPYAV